jgi:hypothetical protein
MTDRKTQDENGLWEFGPLTVTDFTTLEDGFDGLIIRLPMDPESEKSMTELVASGQADVLFMFWIKEKRALEEKP